MSGLPREKVRLTEAGRRTLAARLDELRHEVLPALFVAREDSTEAHVADEELRWAAAEVAALSRVLAHAAPVEDLPDEPRRVELGEKGTLRLDDGSTERYLVVHPAEVVLGGERVAADAPFQQPEHPQPQTGRDGGPWF